MSISVAKIILAILLFLPMFIFFIFMILRIKDDAIREAKNGNAR